jgi:hypothetical protein
MLWCRGPICRGRLVNVQAVGRHKYQNSGEGGRHPRGEGVGGFIHAWHTLPGAFIVLRLQSGLLNHPSAIRCCFRISRLNVTSWAHTTGPFLRSCLRMDNKLVSSWRWRLIALMMEAVSSSETSVNIYQTTRRNIPQDKPSSYSSPWEPEISPSFFLFKSVIVGLRPVWRQQTSKSFPPRPYKYS